MSIVISPYTVSYYTILTRNPREPLILSNLATITNGIAELRNSYGTGHGKDSKAKGLGSRHAKLAVGAASTLAVFLLETHNERCV
jgi:hypothetical protein